MPINKKVICAVLLFKACFIFLLFQTTAQVGFPYCETFQDNSTQSSTVLGGDARLTSGVLRLTSNEKDQNGYVYVDIPFSSVFGIKTSFEYFSYGGTGADGLSVFLFDAETEDFAPGGFGGSLGYAQRDQQPGLTGAYMGIGFDSFGNFGNRIEGKNGGFPGALDLRHPNSIVIRGPGNNFTGYPFVLGLKTNETGTDGLPADQLFPLSSGGIGTQRVTDPEKPGYRKVSVNLEPTNSGIGYLLTIEMIFTTEADNPRLITLFDKVSFPYEAPKDLKIGFAASTGGETNFHEIRNIIVQVSNEDGLLNPTGKDIFDKASCEGQENTYEILSNEINLPNENSAIRCLQLYGSLEEIEAEEEDICAQGKCRPENREMILPQGTFKAADEGGKFTFFPNYGFTGQEVTIFYTVTDSYGKSSAGNALKLLIQESPDPVMLQVEGYSDDITEIRLCKDEKVELLAIGEEEYDRYEWYIDDLLIPESDKKNIEIEGEGAYHVVAYNSKNCPAESERISLINPLFPVLEIVDPVVGCEPNRLLDIRNFIVGYNEDLFDYELETPTDDKLINESMNAIGLSGMYYLRVKHKDLSCWSDPLTFSVVILEEPIVALFDYEVDGTGIKDEAGGGIFIDDPIRFNDESSGNILKWEWDFGDGEKSLEKSPVHVFGKKGNFKITLTVTNDLGCESIYSLMLPITQSYRVMFPTGFTPMEVDNQFFRPKTKGIVKMELMIFNMWGDLIFKTNDLDTPGWDGRLNNEYSPGGNYVYRVNMESFDGEQIMESGNFILIR